jgi:hypothetical protein
VSTQLLGEYVVRLTEVKVELVAENVRFGVTFANLGGPDLEVQHVGGLGKGTVPECGGRAGGRWRLFNSLTPGGRLSRVKGTNRVTSNAGCSVLSRQAAYPGLGQAG